ncbi:MAG: PAS domain S-box protein [bacterium]|nr:PAS domain S-box protein [bacterium]
MEKKFKQSQELAENIINTVREPLIALDQDLRVVSASRSFYTVFQVNPAETVGQLIYNLGNKQWDIPRLRELLEKILPEQTTFDNYEVEHNFAGIGRRTMLLNARQIEQAWGKKRIILLAIEDITERRQLEELLEESEFRYRRLFETASDGIVLLEKKEGHVAHANPAIEKMLGYSEAECLGKKLDAIGISIDKRAFSAIMQDLDREGILNYEDVPLKTRTGKEVYADIYMVDRAILAQCNVRDVSERKLAEKDLHTALIEAHEGRSRAEAIMASMGVGLSIQDSNFKITYQNDFLKNLMGDHLGKRCYSAYENKDGVCEGCPVAMAFRDGGIHKIESAIPMGKETLHLELTASPLRDMQGKIVAAIELVRDVSDQKKLEGQLRHAQRMEAIGTLAGGIAHDFNNMLNVIMGYGAMVMDTLATDSPAKNNMSEVLVAADRAADLTRRLLVFSRKEIFNIRPFNINDLILNLQKMLIRIIRENIEFHLDIADTPLIVMADAGQIEQVLINLASNARAVMLEGGRLIIATSLGEIDEEYVATYGYGQPGKYALITVTDTGQGMDAETQKKIFDPFFTTKGVSEGTGLGLAISYAIIKQHDGYIKVYSEPGEGTVFKIFLPLCNEVAIDKEPEGAVDVKGGNETVLLAEDNDALRKLSSVILESFGYRVIAAEDGEEAIAKFAENREQVNLVMLDMIMPKKNGKEVSEAILIKSPKMKILFVSGYTSEIITNKELDEGGFGFLPKPYTPKDLLAKVRETLDK